MHSGLCNRCRSMRLCIIWRTPRLAAQVSVTGRPAGPLLASCNFGPCNCKVGACSLCCQLKSGASNVLAGTSAQRQRRVAEYTVGCGAAEGSSVG